MSTFCTIDCELCEYCTLNAQGSNYRFTFCEVISSYFYCIVVNHTKIAMQCFPKESTYNQSYTTKWKKCFSICNICKKNCLRQCKNLATFDIFIAK